MPNHHRSLVTLAHVHRGQSGRGRRDEVNVSNRIEQRVVQEFVVDARLGRRSLTIGAIQHQQGENHEQSSRAQGGYQEVVLIISEKLVETIEKVDPYASAKQVDRQHRGRARFSSTRGRLFERSILVKNAQTCVVNQTRLLFHALQAKN